MAVRRNSVISVCGIQGAVPLSAPNGVALSPSSNNANVLLASSSVNGNSVSPLQAFWDGTTGCLRLVLSADCEAVQVSTSDLQQFLVDTEVLLGIQENRKCCSVS